MLLLFELPIIKPDTVRTTTTTIKQSLVDDFDSLYKFPKSICILESVERAQLANRSRTQLTYLCIFVQYINIQLNIQLMAQTGDGLFTFPMKERLKIMTRFFSILYIDQQNRIRSIFRNDDLNLFCNNLCCRTLVSS